MTTADEAKQHAADTLEHRRSYNAIMKAATHVGVPFSMALALFFAQLTMRNGVVVAAISAVIIYVFAWWVVKTFFSTH